MTLSPARPRARSRRFILGSASLIACLTFLSGCGDSGPAPVKPSVKVSGPAGQYLCAGIGYVDADSGSVSFRSSAFTFFLSDEGVWEEEVEDGHDGLVVELFTPTDEPVTLEVLLDGKPHEKVVSKGLGRFRIEVGKAPHEDRGLAYDIRPEPEGRKIVQSIMDGMLDGSVGELISTDEERTVVDATLLGEMMKIAQNRFGKIKTLNPQLWTQGQSDSGGFVTFHVPAEFENGTVVKLTLYVHKGKLVAADENGVLGKGWWEEAAFGETYVELGRTFVTEMIEKRYGDAYARAGKMMKEKMSLEQLKSYREQLPLPDAKIEKIELVDKKTLDIRSDMDRRAQQSFIVEFEGGDKWEAQVNYNFVIEAAYKLGEIIGIEMEESKE